jgi:hypothetical protein
VVDRWGNVASNSCAKKASRQWEAFSAGDRLAFPPTGNAGEAKTKPSRALADKIMARFADGKWHALDAIAARLESGADDIPAYREQFNSGVEYQRL